MKKFDFLDINLLPKFSIVNSRSECDTSITFGGKSFKCPIVPANMECVIDQALAMKLAQNGYFYIMHRFDIDVIEFVRTFKAANLVTSISIGVNEDSYLIIDNLIKENLIPDFITIDIAHGYSIKMKNLLSYLSKLDSFIIAGNVCTPEAVQDLVKWGADCVKVGISPGSACTTDPTTGFGSRRMQASTIYNCSKPFKNYNIPDPESKLLSTGLIKIKSEFFDNRTSRFRRYPSPPLIVRSDVYTKRGEVVKIIADGGIRCPADITKAIVLGADMVMVGGMFSGFNDSPGNCVIVNDKMKKEFWGSASSSQSGKKNRIEGIKTLVDYKDESLLDYYSYIVECMQSSISYAGGKDITALKNVEWI